MQKTATIDELPSLPRPLSFWFFFFALTIGLFGSVLLVPIAAPLMALGRWFTPFEKAGGQVMQGAVRLLLWAQPWLTFHRNLNELSLRQKIGTPFVTLSNHRSHLDMFLLLSTIPGIQVAAKRSLFFILPLTPFLILMRMRPIRSGDIAGYQKALAKLASEALLGKNVHYFPEMTRCPEGSTGTLPFHLAVFHEIKKADLDIVPLVFLGTDLCWPKGIAGIRWGQTAKLHALPPIKASDFPTAEALSQAVRTRINEEIQLKMGRAE